MNIVLSKTVFAHFCGGQNIKDLNSTIDNLENSKICGIIDYAAEAPIGGGLKIDYKASADRTVETIELSVAKAEYPEMAAKLTAFMDHSELVQTTELIHISRELYRILSLGLTNIGSSYAHPHDYQVFDVNPITYESYKSSTTELGWDTIPESKFDEILRFAKTFKQFAGKEFGVVQRPPTSTDSLHYHEFEALLFSFVISNEKRNHPMWSLLKDAYEWRQKFDQALDIFSLDTIYSGNNLLTDVLDVLQEVAFKRENLPKPFVMMDAEGSECQAAIDLITNHHTLRVNKPNSIVFGNTYQHYLKDTYSRLLHDHFVSQLYKVPFGAKMVRGAYMTSEKRRSHILTRPNPVHDKIESTHDSYNKSIMYAMDYCERGDMRVCFGTHNEDSVELEAERLALKGTPLKRGSVTVGQLLGMSDALTQKIVDKIHLGILAGKYVPYGPIDLVIPYLLRRVEENADALTRVKTDEQYLKSLLWNRQHGSEPMRAKSYST